MSRHRVMVVDEYEDSRNKIVQIVAEHGFEAYSASDGIDALRQIYDVMPQIVVFDAAVPDRSGFKFLPFVKRRFPEIGVVLLAEILAQSPQRQASLAADVILTKSELEPIGFIRSLEQVLLRCPPESVNRGTVCACKAGNPARRM